MGLKGKCGEDVSETRNECLLRWHGTEAILRCVLHKTCSHLTSHVGSATCPRIPGVNMNWARGDR